MEFCAIFFIELLTFNFVKWSKSTPALARPTNTQAEESFESRQSVPEPGILFLGLAGVMMDSMKSSKKRTSRLNAGSAGAEAVTGDEEGMQKLGELSTGTMVTH